MRGVLIGFGCVVALIAATFLPQVKDYRAEKAYEYFVQGKFKSAKWLYFYGKFQGDQKSANNYHVLNYRIARFDEGLSQKRLLSTRRKTFRAFDKLTQEGHIPAAYNAGMFYYGAKAGTADYAKGLMYFDHAAVSGDEMSRYAADIMRAGAHTKEKKYQELRKSADTGNAWAAYRYVKTLRFEADKLRRSEKYAVMGAEAGYADAQRFLGVHFTERKDAKSWLEKAATNPQDRSLLATDSLAKLAEKEIDFAAKRQWLILGSTPKAKFRHAVLNEPDGLRWRGLQNTFVPDINNSKAAAYNLALMQVEGLGGAVDIEGAIANLKYAEEWSDAPQLLSQLQSGANVLDRKTRHQSASAQPKTDLERFDQQKNFPFHSKLRPYMVSKQIRYTTQEDLRKFKQGVWTRFTKSGFKKNRQAGGCSIRSTCFYIEKPIILPPGMTGAYSATFLVNPAHYLPKQDVGHNRYIFLSDRHIP